MISLYKTLEFDILREHLAGLAASHLGRERIHNIQPFTNLADVEKSLNQITEMRDLSDYDQPPPFDEIADIHHILEKARLVGSMLQPEEIADVLHFIIIIRRLTNYFRERQERIPVLGEITSRLVSLQSLEKTIDQCIDSVTFQIKSSASPELASIRKSIDRAQTSARKKMESLLKNYAEKGLLQENIIAVRNGRLVLVVKDEHKRKVKGLVHDQSATGASFFIEPLSVVEDNNRIRELEAEEAKEIERILRQLTNAIREEHTALAENLLLFGELDFIHAKARLSQVLNAFQPELDNNPIISLVHAQHPLLLLRMGEKNVVSLDITLGDKNHTLIISGPNAGGKTVALKTVGLLTLMTSCGLHIPAQPHSKVGLMRKIFADIGDQQSIENDLSTFSSHLQALKEIDEKADAQSLVLIDEIGAATDPEEGTALAIALLERLNKRKSLSIVTTHQSPLKAFAYQTEGVENASLEFDIESLRPTYRFRTGIPGSSYAFEIAQRMGLPVEVTDRARIMIGSHKNKLEGLILELEERVQQYTRLSREANIKETEYKGLLKLYTERNEALKRETNAIKRQAVQEAEAMLQESNAAIEQAIREIRESNAQKQQVKMARQNVARQKEKIKTIQEQIKTTPATPVQDEAIKKGDFVIWRISGARGQVMNHPDKKRRVTVQFDGGMKASVPASELEIDDTKRQPKTMVRLNVASDKHYSREVDLRGLLGEEAINVLDQFLDEALLAGFEYVHIIHGKGTGKLRKVVGNYLQKHAQVKEFRLGYWNEGDSGVTVVELKGKKKITNAIQE
ncbi:endonuclease MutS2 [candidate division KSB1 bacterium]|nr:endonuclease MutS2 [candidate division KSB1 bacterium]